MQDKSQTIIHNSPLSYRCEKSIFMKEMEKSRCRQVNKMGCGLEPGNQNLHKTQKYYHSHFKTAVLLSALKYPPAALESFLLLKKSTNFGELYGNFIVNHNLEFLYADRLAKQMLEATFFPLQGTNLIDLILTQDTQFLSRCQQGILDQSWVQYLVYSKRAFRKYNRFPELRHPTKKDYFYRYLKGLTSRISPMSMDFTNWRNRVSADCWVLPGVEKLGTVKCFLFTTKWSARIPRLDEFDFEKDWKINKFQLLLAAKQDRKKYRRVQKLSQVEAELLADETDEEYCKMQSGADFKVKIELKKQFELREAINSRRRRLSKKRKFIVKKDETLPYLQKIMRKKKIKQERLAKHHTSTNSLAKLNPLTLYSPIIYSQTTTTNQNSQFNSNQLLKQPINGTPITCQFSWSLQKLLQYVPQYSISWQPCVPVCYHPGQPVGMNQPEQPVGMNQPGQLVEMHQLVRMMQCQKIQQYFLERGYCLDDDRHLQQILA